jgi:hypothetical protein
MPETDKHCFVIGPIGDEASPERKHADWLLKGIIRPVFEKDFSDWRVYRADEITTPGMISAQIINRLHVVALVLADLSFHNANAFYEMSIRHNVGKPIIHLIRKGENIPFDVIPHRAIKFLYDHPNDLDEAQKHLRDAVQEAIAPGFQPDNPIMHARGRLEFEQKATPEMKVLSDEIASLRARFDALVSSLSESSLFRPVAGLGRDPWTGFTLPQAPGGVPPLQAILGVPPTDTPDAKPNAKPRGGILGSE